MQAKRKKWLLIVGGLAIFLLLVATFGNGHIAYAAAPQCSDGIDNDGDGIIDMQDAGCVSAQDNDETDPSMYLPQMPACNGSFGFMMPASLSYGWNYNEVPENWRAGGDVTDTQYGNSLDWYWVQTWAPNYFDWDLVTSTNKVRIYPSQDHGPYPEEFNEYTVEVSSDQTNWWIPTQTGLYVDDYANVRVHDGVKDYFSTSTFKYIRVAPTNGDFEIDAVQGCGIIFQNQPPVITLLGSNPMTVQLNATFTDPGATSTDPEDGNLTSSITATGTVNTTATGTYPILYTITDSGGLTATTTRIVNVVYAPPIYQCSDGIDNDSDGMIDAADPNCHTDVNRYNPASYDPSINLEYGVACVWRCPYSPKAGKIIMYFDQAHNIKSNGTAAESKMPVVSVNIPAGYYNVSLDSFDGYASRPTDASQPNEIWKALLMNGSDLVAETIHTVDLADQYTCISQTHDDIQTNFFVAKDVDSVIGQHAAYPDNSSSNDLWAVCAAFDSVPTPPQCSDSIDNDGDGTIDINDKTCHSDAVATNTVSYLPGKNTENELPVITLIGASSIEIFVGDSYTDQGATALDFEDGNITSSITATGTVANQTAGTYSIYYDVKDSQGAPAQQKVRTVVVKVRPPSGCVGNCGGGGAVTPQTVPSLSIFNEKVEATSNNSALITWQTDANADSRVVYGTSSVNSLVAGNANYGYATTTLTANGLILNHSLLITNLQPKTNYYFRPVSDNPSVNPATGKELSLIIDEQPPVIIATVVPPATIDCNYLLEYLRIDLPNNPIEVIKLQKFLKENQGFANLQVNGVFDRATLDAVDTFQMRYFVDVLTPWGYDYNQPTGYVYITTKKKVNEIYCQKPFPLTSGQEDEITDMRNYLQTIPRVIPPTPTPIIGQFKTPETQGELAAGSNATESAIVSPDNQGSAIAQATTSGPSPTPEISSALGVSSITNIGNIGETNTSSQGTKPSRMEPLFLVGFIGKLANTENNLLMGIYLIVILVALAFVFIIIKRRRKQWRSFSPSNSNVSPFGNFSVADNSPAFSDKL